MAAQYKQLLNHNVLTYYYNSVPIETTVLLHKMKCVRGKKEKKTFEGWEVKSRFPGCSLTVWSFTDSWGGYSNTVAEFISQWWRFNGYLRKYGGGKCHYREKSSQLWSVCERACPSIPSLWLKAGSPPTLCRALSLVYRTCLRPGTHTAIAAALKLPYLLGVSWLGRWSAAFPYFRKGNVNCGGRGRVWHTSLTGYWCNVMLNEFLWTEAMA